MDGTQHVCINCIDDGVVKRWIEDLSSTAACSYCEENALAVDLKTLSEWVDKAYKECFMPNNSYGFDDCGDSPEYIISMMLNSSDDIGSDVASYLSASEARDVSQGSDPMYDAGQSYVHQDINGVDHHGLWQAFCQSIKHESRFFSLSAKDFLDNIFHGIEEHLTYHDEKLIYYIRLDNVYRARRAGSKSELDKILADPECELYAPPESVAPNGRMNANGISIFYGAFDSETCLAEVRLAVGEIAVVAAFSSSEALKVFDATKLDHLSNNLSYFASDYLMRSSQIVFLSEFQQVISRPVMPSTESLDYLPTQAMTEYLATFKGVDAILFSSSQTSGKNAAVLVSKIKLDSRGDFVKYEERQKPLSLIEDSVCIHKIQSVRYESEKVSQNLGGFEISDDLAT